MVGFLIFLAIVAGIVFWVISLYNNLIALKNGVANSWSQIDVQLKRRYDLIPNLVETVKGYMKFEQETLTKVIEARNKAVAAPTVEAKAQAEGELSGVLNRLFALTENYPELKSNQNALQLQEELTTTENKISFARQFYNDIVMKFNTAQQVFPTNMIAQNLGFKPADFFNIPETEKVVPKVDLKF